MICRKLPRYVIYIYIHIQWLCKHTPSWNLALHPKTSEGWFRTFLSLRVCMLPIIHPDFSPTGSNTTCLAIRVWICDQALDFAIKRHDFFVASKQKTWEQASDGMPWANKGTWTCSSQWSWLFCFMDPGQARRLQQNWQVTLIFSVQRFVHSNLPPMSSTCRKSAAHSRL